MLSVSSRFSVLKLDEDIEEEKRKREQRESSKKGQNGPILVNNKKQKLTNSSKSSQIDSKKQAMKFNQTDFAIGANLQSNNKKAKQKKKAKEVNDSNQWDEWKDNDAKQNDSKYVHDLREAMLLSKQEFENEKIINVPKIGEGQNDNNDEGPAKMKKKKKKQSKPAAVSLDQFLASDEAQVDKAQNGLSVAREPIGGDPLNEILKQIDREAEKVIRIENNIEKMKKKEKKRLDESVIYLQFEQEIKKKDVEIHTYKDHVQKLENELKAVKNRNKKLCHILASGEMKEKAEILVDMEKLTQINEELKEEVLQLNAALEQEKSKVHILQDDLKKNQYLVSRKRNDSLSK